MSWSRARVVAAACIVAIGAAACSVKRPPAAVAAAPRAEEPILNVLDASYPIAPEAVARFEAETGIKVHFDPFDGEEGLESRLLAGRTGDDVVVPSDYILEREAVQGTLLPLDKAKLPHYPNLDPQALKALQGADPGNRYGVPYAGVVIGLAYNPAKVRQALGAAPVDSWSILFDPKSVAKLKDCGVSLPDQPLEVFASTQLWLQADPTAAHPVQLDAIEAALMKVRPWVRYFHGSRYIDELAQGATCIAIGRSADVLQLRDRLREAGKGVGIAFAVPQEGALRGWDLLAIPADAAHPDNAHKFIDFLLRADIAAQFTTLRKVPSGNQAATPLIAEQLRAEPLIFPPQDVVARLTARRTDSPSDARLANRAWARVHNGR